MGNENGKRSGVQKLFDKKKMWIQCVDMLIDCYADSNAKERIEELVRWPLFYIELIEIEIEIELGLY